MWASLRDGIGGKKRPNDRVTLGKTLMWEIIWKPSAGPIIIIGQSKAIISSWRFCRKFYLVRSCKFKVQSYFVKLDYSFIFFLLFLCIVLVLSHYCSMFMFFLFFHILLTPISCFEVFFSFVFLLLFICLVQISFHKKLFLVWFTSFS